MNVAEHAAEVSKFKPSLADAKHDLAEFASLVGGRDLLEHQKATIALMKDWLDRGELNANLFDFPPRPRPMFSHPSFEDVEMRCLAAMAAVPRTIHSMIHSTAKADKIVLDIESYGFDDRRWWVMDDLHFASGPGQGKTWAMQQMREPAIYVSGKAKEKLSLIAEKDTLAKAAVDRLVVAGTLPKPPTDFTPKVPEYSNRAARRRAGRKNRG
jgi:hypothetical protein